MFGCTAGTDRRRVAFGLGRSLAAGPGGRTEASRLLLAGATGCHRGAAGGGALQGEEVAAARGGLGEEKEDCCCRSRCHRHCRRRGRMAAGRGAGARQCRAASRAVPGPARPARPAGARTLFSAGCGGLYIHTHSVPLRMPRALHDGVCGALPGGMLGGARCASVARRALRGVPCSFQDM
jgi:hypothetical protein